MPALGLGSLLLAMGDNLPLYRLAFDVIPGVAMFRIPARIMVLFNLAVAILAGLGVHRLLATRELPGLRRVVVWLAALAAASAPAMYLLLLWSDAGALENAVATLADQYVLLLLALVLTLAVVAWQARRDSPRLVRVAILGVLVLDLVFGSLPLNGGTSHPDRESIRDRELARFFAATPEPYRANLDARLDPTTIYRYGISVVDGGSTFAPSRFLDLYFLSEEHPRILDLLNVQYLVRLPRKPPAEPGGALRLPPGAVQRLELGVARAGRRLDVDSYLIGAREVPDGAVVATVHVIDAAGASQAWPIRAGRETAEWTMDRVGGTVAHAKPPVARSWTMSNEAFEGHSYRASFAIPPGFRVTELIVEREGTESWLHVEQVRLDGQPLARERSFRRVRPDLLENQTVLPRAFLVRRVRRVPSEQVLEQVPWLDPATEALVSDPLPAGWPARVPLVRRPPLPQVRVAEYAPHRVRLETTVDEPVLLILSDTYAPGWQAWDNGRPVAILRTDHALRGVPLGAGSHTVEFRYRQPEFWLGLAISGLTVLGLAVGGVFACRRARARRAGGP